MIATVKENQLRKKEQWKKNYFDILASGKTDYHCKVEKTLFIIQGVQPALNVNVNSEFLLY